MLQLQKWNRFAAGRRTTLFKVFQVFGCQQTFEKIDILFDNFDICGRVRDAVVEVE